MTISRRKFLELVAAGAATAVVPLSLLGDEGVLPPNEPLPRYTHVGSGMVMTKGDMQWMIRYEWDRDAGDIRVASYWRMRQPESNWPDWEAKP